MTSPTREQILAAHYATEQLALLATSITERQDVKDYKEMILRALPPRPQPTMADVVWDDDKHHLSEAETEMGTKVIMLWESTMGRISVINGGIVGTLRPENLTPTGRRYTLTEVQE